MSRDDVVRGFAALRWPARVEVVGEKPWLVIDGAHNAASAAALADTLRTCFPPARRTLVFGTTRDKDLEAQLRALLPLFDVIIATRYVENPRAVAPEDIAAAVFELTGRTARHRRRPGRGARAGAAVDRTRRPDLRDRLALPGRRIARDRHAACPRAVDHRRCHVTVKQTPHPERSASNQAFWKEEAMSTSFWLRVGAIWGFLAVAIGAFGAHGLKDRFKSLGDQFGPLDDRAARGDLPDRHALSRLLRPGRSWPWACWPRAAATAPPCRSPAGRSCSGR